VELRRRVPFIPQMEMSECGAASLAMMLAYHGHHAPLPEVRQACGVSRDGASALGILRAARSYGLEAEGVTLEMDGLKDLPLPAILHWGFRHFVVLERLLPNKATLVDPSLGRRTVDLEEIEERFTGVAIVAVPSEGFSRREETRPSFRRYRAVIRESLPTLAQLLCASMMLQLLGLVFPISTQFLLDRIILPRQGNLLWGLAFGLGAAVVGNALLSVMRSWVVQGFEYSMDLGLLSGFVEHLLLLPLSFFLQRSTGDLFQRVESNAVLSDLFTTRTIAAVLDTFLVIGYALLMLLYSPALGGLVLILGLTRVIVLLALRARNRQIMSAELAAAGRESASLVEALSTIETTKASGAQAYVIRRWSDRMATQMNSNVQRRTLEIASSQVMMGLQGIGFAAILWIGGRAVLTEQMTLGVFAAFLTLQGLFMVPLEALLGAATQMQYMSSHLQRLDDVFDSRIEVAGPIDPGRISGAIELEDVTFGYVPGATPVVSGLTLSIAPGEKIAVVGPAGAGKSTLAQLLLGLHVPISGHIRFDGIDLPDIDLPLLRRQMGVVLQETYFFDDTVRANLSLHDPDLPVERLREASEIACISGVIDALPEGYDTMMGANGNRFSGGERQRLALARALVHEPAILLLDEATRALDLETERRLHANLAAKRCTRILITHRLATLEDADRIVVMQSGRIVDIGTFDALSARNGVFHDFILSEAKAHV
jgi:ATP-binding cassette subfamily B protein